jgi:serine/threonine protein kinase
MQHVQGGQVDRSFKELKARLDANVITQAEYDGTLAYLMRGTLNGLKAMEDVGLVHHDIKPKNVMLDAETLQPVLIDMGLAKKKGAGEHDMEGTRGYMEGYLDSDGEYWRTTDGTRDVYSVGSTLFEAKEDTDFADHRGVPKRFSFSHAAPHTTYDPTSAADPKKRAVPEREAGQIAEGGTKLAYPDFLRKAMYSSETTYRRTKDGSVTADGRLSIDEALNHPYLADSPISDERAREILAELLKSRKLEQKTKELARTAEQLPDDITQLNVKELIAEIEKLDPADLKTRVEQQVEALVKWKEKVRVGCSSTFESQTDREKCVSDFEKALLPTRTKLEEVEPPLKRLRQLIRWLVAKSASTKGKKLEAFSKVLKEIETAQGEARNLLGSCDRMLRAVQEQTWAATYAADNKQLQEDAKAALDSAEIAWERTDSLAVNYEELVTSARKLASMPSPDLLFAAELNSTRAKLEKEYENWKSPEGVTKARSTLDALRKRAEIDETLGLRHQTDTLNRLLREAGIAIQRATSARLEAQGLWAKFDVLRTENSQPTAVLAKEVEIVKKAWDLYLDGANNRTRTRPDKDDNEIAFRSIPKLAQGKLDPVEASRVLAGVRELLKKSHQRLEAHAVMKEAIQRLNRVAAVFAEAIVGPDFDPLRQIDPNLESEVGRTKLLEEISEGGQLWLELSRLCAELLNSPAGKKVVEMKQVQDALAGGEEYRKNGRELTGRVNSLRDNTRAVLEFARMACQAVDSEQEGAQDLIQTVRLDAQKLHERSEREESQLENLHHTVQKLLIATTASDTNDSTRARGLYNECLELQQQLTSMLKDIKRGIGQIEEVLQGR